MIKKLFLDNSGGPIRYTEISSSSNAFCNAVYGSGSLAGMYDAPTGTTNAQVGNYYQALYMYNAGASVSGVCYFGQQNITKKVKYIKLWQGYFCDVPASNYSVSSAKIQKCIDGTNWVDIQTVVLQYQQWQKITVDDYTFSGTHKIRLLANSGVVQGDNSLWAIDEFRIFVEDPAGTLKAEDI